MTKDWEEAVSRIYPVQLNAYCAKLAENSASIHALYYPDPRELEDPGLPPDGLGEIGQSPVPKLIHRYSDRAALLTTTRCFVHCRFCFRKRLWKCGCRDEDLSETELQNVCAYLKQHREITDVLLTGGDVLTLPDETVLNLIRNLKRAGAETVRVCSRAPAVAPERITDALAAALGAEEGVWFITHFDHPDELTEAARTACRKLTSHGVPVLDQTVLLKGVNDDAGTLMKLFRTLISWRVKPHYLFHIDPVEGVSHFATGVAAGLALMESFRGSLSSLALPAFAIDLPEGGGKVILTPDERCSDGGYYSAIRKKSIRHPLAELSEENK